MKKQRLLKIVFVSASLAFAGCETIPFNTSTFRTAETKDVFVSAPMIIEYDTILNGIVSDTSLFQETAEGVDYVNLKKRAIVNCCKKHDCDVLINPSFHVSKKSYNITIVVSGLPAKYRYIRPATPDDRWMLDFMEHK